MNARLKAGLLTGMVAGTIIMSTGCALKHEEKEGFMNEDLPIVDVVDPEEYEDRILDKVDEPIKDLEISKSVYDILDGKGYNLEMFPDFERSLLDTHSYIPFEHNLGVTTTDVNFRTGPDTTYDIIVTLDPATAVDLVAKCDNGWYLVQRNGTMGFIRGDYIREVNDAAILEQMRNLPELVPGVQTTTGVNVRPEPNTDNQEYTTLEKGQTLKMVRKLDNGWYEVIYDGKIAYICGDYVKEVVMLDAEALNLVAMKKDAIVYDVPFGMEMGSIPQYEIARVYGEIEGFYYVESNGQIGFVPKEICSKLTNTSVIVDISDQTASLYRGTELIMVTDVVTGKDSTPSDLGIFDIDAVEANATLRGADYAVDVNYWMPYNGGEGLHDATWRGSFGGSIYHNSGSHGCVNMPKSAAATVFENVSTGDSVVVKR